LQVCKSIIAHNGWNIIITIALMNQKERSTGTKIRRKSIRLYKIKMTLSSFNQLSKIPPSNQISVNIPEIIRKELTEKEILKIDMRFLGDIIFGQAKSLSLRVNNELLEPINFWLSDSDWIKGFQNQDISGPDWAKYKRVSRQWTKQQRYLAQERLKQYWQAIRQKKDLRQEISRLIGKPCAGQKNSFRGTGDFLLPIIKPFTRHEQNRIDLEKEFLKAMDISLSYLLPWSVMLTTDIKAEKKFSELKVYLHEDKKMDKICKLMNLLQLENDGVISLNQTEPFEDFKIQIKECVTSQISLKDRCGNEWDQDWFELSNEDRNKMIEEIKSHQIICKQL